MACKNTCKGLALLILLFSFAFSTDDRVLSEYASHPVFSELLDIRGMKKIIEKLRRIGKRKKQN